MTRVICYPEDNHPLSKVETEMDAHVNTLMLFVSTGTGDREPMQASYPFHSETVHPRYVRANERNKNENRNDGDPSAQ